MLSSSHELGAASSKDVLNRTRKSCCPREEALSPSPFPIYISVCSYRGPSKIPAISIIHCRLMQLVRKIKCADISALAFVGLELNHGAVTKQICSLIYVNCSKHPQRHKPFLNEQHDKFRLNIDVGRSGESKITSGKCPSCTTSASSLTRI